VCVSGERRFISCASVITALALVSVTLGVDAGAAPPSSGQLVKRLSKQPFERRMLPAGFTLGYVCDSTTKGGCATKVPSAAGFVRSDFRGPDVAIVFYSIFPDARSARAWFGGGGREPKFSLWRLKQLNVESLPHARISGRVPGFPNSVIVESSGHKNLYRTGTTEFNVLSGDVIVNVTTGSQTSRQHGNRVVAAKLLKAAVARLNGAGR
jgi:hypothetical protein